MATTTRLERILQAKRLLPDDQRVIFDDLFVRLKSEEEVCKLRGLTQTQLQAVSVKMLRSLRAAAV